MMPRVLLVALLALAPAMAGCARPAQEDAARAEVAEALADTRAMDWSEGNWWAYRATIEDVSFDIAIVVHRADEQGFRLGTNLSAGFFGLPWSGNVTSDLNPRIGGDEWALFDFPLEDGKSWSYRMLGYEAKTTARATTVEVPEAGAQPGFSMESSAYGQLFARYDYVPAVGWFTRLTLIEPTNGQAVLDAQLIAYGTDWDAAYYVEETVREVAIVYPAAPDVLALEIPGSYLQLRAVLTAESGAGAVDAQLRDEAGRHLASARVVVMGADTERASARAREDTTWTLEHAGAGRGRVHLEVTGVAATGPLAEPAPPPAQLDLARLLQSGRPAYPQLGQTSSLALLPSPGA